jgi:hypothetical protein
VIGGIPHGALCSPVWFAECLPRKFGAGSGDGSDKGSSPVFLVLWHGEVFYRLGVQGVKVLILLGALFLPNVAPVFQQDFGVWELMLPGSAP